MPTNDIDCKTKEEVSIIKVKIENIEKNIGELKTSHKEMYKELKEFFQKADEKYATKAELDKVVTRLEASRNWLMSNWDKLLHFLFLAFLGFLVIYDKLL